MCVCVWIHLKFCDNQFRFMWIYENQDKIFSALEIQKIKRTHQKPKQIIKP